jgi:hypothetical protein
MCLRMAPLDSSERRRLAAELGAPPARDPLEAILVHLKGLPEADRRKALEGLKGGRDRPEPRERLLVLWDELERMAGDGVDVESHGATHAALTGLAAEDLERELASAREKLLERGHGRHGLVAYPFGAWNRRIAEAAARLGYRAGFTGVWGLASSSEDAMGLPRLTVHEDAFRTRAEFLFRIPGAA